jgi:peptidoglycan/LPS O-acetylase OafA/YrhL
MVKLGEWSFALYLVHELVLRTALELGPETLAQRAVFAVVGIVISIPLAGAAYTFFERPVEARLGTGDRVAAPWRTHRSRRRAWWPSSAGRTGSPQLNPRNPM